MPFLSDPKFLRYKGFQLADTAEPYYELLYLPFAPDAAKPCFADSVKSPQVDDNGFVLYYSHQCPFTAKYVPIVQAIAEQHGVPFTAIRLTSKEEAQQAPAPFTAYSLFYAGHFVGNEILSEKKFTKMLADLGL